MAAVSSVSPATPFQNVPPTVSQTPVIAATPVPTITANVTPVPVPPAAAPAPPMAPIIPVVPPTPPVVKVSVLGCEAGWVLCTGQGGAGGAQLPFLGHCPRASMWYVWLWSGLSVWEATAPNAKEETEAQVAAGHTAGEGGLRLVPGCSDPELLPCWFMGHSGEGVAEEVGGGAPFAAHTWMHGAPFSPRPPDGLGAECARPSRVGLARLLLGAGPVWALICVVFSGLTLTATLWGRQCFPHLTHEEAGARRGLMAPPGKCRVRCSPPLGLTACTMGRAQLGHVTQPSWFWSMSQSPWPDGSPEPTAARAWHPKGTR